MKTLAICLAGLVMTGCAAVDTKPEAEATYERTAGDDQSVRPKTQVLSKEAAAELGGDDLVFTAAIRRDGSIQLFRPEGVTTRRIRLPEAATRIDSIRPLVVVEYQQNPTCLLWAESYVIGGTLYDRFCLFSR